MERILVFAALQLFVSVYAITRGGAPERAVGLSLLIAALATRLLQQPLAARFVTVEWGGLVVDLALLAVLLIVALHADRFWPLWVAAFHALGTGAHMVRGLDHGIEPVAYAILVASWSYPIVLLLAVGTMRHADRRKRQGHDRDWSFPLMRGAGAA
jgi:hypothetical protein